MKTAEREIGSSDRASSEQTALSSHIAASADRIIAAYKEHYSFPPQGESHMHDCIMDAYAGVNGDLLLALERIAKLHTNTLPDGTEWTVNDCFRVAQGIANSAIARATAI